MNLPREIQLKAHFGPRMKIVARPCYMVVYRQKQHIGAKATLSVWRMALLPKIPKKFLVLTFICLEFSWQYFVYNIFNEIHQDKQIRIMFITKNIYLSYYTFELNIYCIRGYLRLTSFFPMKQTSYVMFIKYVYSVPSVECAPLYWAVPDLKVKVINPHNVVSRHFVW